MAAASDTNLSSAQREDLLKLLEIRFQKNPQRHKGLVWDEIVSRLKAHPEKLWSLHEMERTGGEPDVVGVDGSTGKFIFYDCSPETPKGRRSVCYDPEALKARKKFPPEHSAVELANAMGVELLTEDEYHKLQLLGEFDNKTSSWLKTPPGIRKRGGAIFGDRRYGRVFIYHNGAESYYAARSFRASLRV